jgi:hypothetical protein
MREPNPNMRRVRAPAAVESAIKAERRRLILEIMSYDSLYHRKGDFINSCTVSIMIGITIMQAAHVLGDMARKAGLLDATQRNVMTKSGSHMSNVYKLKQKSLLSKPWRTHPNYHPMPSRWQLGAVI